MAITATELKTNKYLNPAAKADISFTQHMVVTKMSNPLPDRLETAESLFGSISPTMTLEEAQEERLSKR